MKNYIVNAVVALLLIIGVGVVMPKAQPAPQQSDVNLGGLSDRNIKAVSLELLSVGTTTVKAKSSTPNRGLCIETYATSSATTINLTLQASTTAVSASGIAWVPRYGSCR